MNAKYAPGRYLVEITQQGITEAKTGTPQLALRFNILGKVDPADPQGDLIACEPGERTAYRAITEKTVEFVMEDLEYLGITGITSWKQISDPDAAGYVDLGGKQVEMFCEHETYNNSTNEKWKLARGGSSEMKKVEPQVVRQLDAMFGKALKGLGKPANGGNGAAKPGTVARPARAAAASSSEPPDFPNPDPTDDEVPL